MGRRSRGTREKEKESKEEESPVSTDSLSNRGQKKRIKKTHLPDPEEPIYKEEEEAEQELEMEPSSADKSSDDDVSNSEEDAAEEANDDDDDADADSGSLDDEAIEELTHQLNFDLESLFRISKIEDDRQLIQRVGLILTRPDQISNVKLRSIANLLRATNSILPVLNIYGDEIKNIILPNPYSFHRQKLQTIGNSLEDAVELIKKSKNIIVVTGAGVSVSCGIPDFRSSQGIYKMIGEQFDFLDKKPELLFDYEFFLNDPIPFYKFAKQLYPGKYQPSKTHKFIKMLERHGKLLRNYTQNIDTLEMEAGINRVVYCHGSFRWAECTKCKVIVDGNVIKEEILSSVVAKCKKCTGLMKPKIVFFGQQLSKTFKRKILADAEKTDLLIVIGSSMKVQPVCLIPSIILDETVPQILINKEIIMQPHQFDCELLGECDPLIEQIMEKLNWKLEDEIQEVKRDDDEELDEFDQLECEIEENVNSAGSEDENYADDDDDYVE